MPNTNRMRKQLRTGLGRVARSARRRLGGDGGGGTPQPSGPARGGVPLTNAVRRGRPLAAVLLGEARKLVRTDEPELASVLAESLASHEETADLGALVTGVVAYQRGFHEKSWAAFSRTPAVLWAPHAPTEFVRAGLEVDEAAMYAAVRAVLADPPAGMEPRRWVDLLDPVFASGEYDLSRELLEHLDRTGQVAALGEKSATRRDWIARWLARTPDERTAPAPETGIPFAVLEYDHPRRPHASANIGDHVQSVASLGHVVRHRNIELVGAPDLVQLAGELRDRVRPERVREEATGKLALVAAPRDATMYYELPENTWALAFGWYMHALSGHRYGFPFHKNLLPIFVSFHCNKREMLTPAAIDYLRSYGPIGCRDWTTVDLLLSVDVPAFFSGCLTTTVDTVFPDRPEASGESRPDLPTAYVDMPEQVVPEGARTFEHSSDAIRPRPFADNVRDAVDLLETYRRDYGKIITSRLHCALPMRSLGSDVDFEPKNRSDVRFAGLIGIDDDAFFAIRNGINEKLETVIARIAAGDTPDQVYGLWRELCAPDVAAARARRELADLPIPEVSVADALAHAAASAIELNEQAIPAGADPVHVAIPVGPHRPPVLTTLLSSVVRNSSRPVHVHLLAREPLTGELAGVAAAVPQARVSVIPTQGLGGDLAKGTTRISARDAATQFDLVMLPGLLPGVERVVVIPLPALVLGDVAELADTDLGSSVLGGTPVPASSGTSGFGVLHLAGNALGKRTQLSQELRRQAFARHVFDFPAFETEVMVLDLAGLRGSGLPDRAAGLMQQFGLPGRTLLHFWFGPDHVELPSAWHVVPTRSESAGAQLIHWAEVGRPWNNDFAPLQDLWLSERDGRAATPAAPSQSV